MKSLRETIESILFAGLKPSGGRPQVPVAPPPVTRWGRLRERIDLWISGGADPADPLYLTHRTTAQKLRAWSVVAVPLVILVGGAVLVFLTIGNRHDAKEAKDLSPAESAAKLLPNLNDIKIESSSSVDVVEVRVDKSAGVRVVGTVRNKSNHPIASADVTCQVTDANSTQLTSIVFHVENIAPGATKDFSVPLTQQDAAYVLVSDISSR